MTPSWDRSVVMLPPAGVSVGFFRRPKWNWPRPKMRFGSVSVCASSVGDLCVDRWVVVLLGAGWGLSEMSARYPWGDLQGVKVKASPRILHC